MKRTIILLFFIFNTFKGNCQYDDSSSYVGINVLPLITHQYEILYEKNINPYITIELNTGFVNNAPYGCLYKIGTPYSLIKRSGFFLKTGLKIHLKSKIITPFLGIKLINSLAIEEGYYDNFDNDNDRILLKENNYNLGGAGTVGISIGPISRIIIDIGLQFGYLFIDNLMDVHSYTPGMGLNWMPMKTQSILQIKYKIKK